MLKLSHIVTQTQFSLIVEYNCSKIYTLKMIPKSFSHSNDNGNYYQKESVKFTCIQLSLVVEVAVEIWVFIKSSKEHISHTLTSYMYVYINVTK